MKYRPRWRQAASPLALLVVVALCWSVAFPYFEATRNANERPRLMQGLALAERGEWNIDAVMRAQVDPGPDIARVNGRTFPNKPPAVSVLAALGYSAAKVEASIEGTALTWREWTWWARLFSGLMPTLAFVWLAFRRWEDRFGAPVCMGAILCYLFATPVASYVRLAYGHQLAASLAGCGILMLFRAFDRDGRTWHAALGGCLCALAISADYLAVFCGPAIGGWLLWRAATQNGWRLALSGVFGAFVGVIPLAMYHAHAYGSVFSTGYHHVVVADFAQKHGEGLLGLTWPTWARVYDRIFAPGAGLLWWAPLVFLGVWGLWRLSRASESDRSEARLCLAVFACIFAVSLGLNFDGGWRVGPRYLIVGMCTLVPGWAYVFAAYRDQFQWMLGIGIVLFYSLVLNCAAGALWPHFDLEHIVSPAAEVLWPLYEQKVQPYGPAFRAQLPSPAWIWLGIPVIVTWFVYARLMVFGYRNLIAWVCAAIIGGAALRTLPFLPKPHADAQRNLQYILRVWEPRAWTEDKDPRPSKPVPTLR